METQADLTDKDIILKLKSLCDENFINVMYRPYAGANLECIFCCAVKRRNGTVNHDNDCAHIKYSELIKNLNLTPTQKELDEQERHDKKFMADLVDSLEENY